MNEDRLSDFTGLESIVLPVALAPRKGKYYGTRILDANGDEVCSIWSSKGNPSSREKEYFGEDWTPEAWKDYCCDSHWESEQSLKRAEWLVSTLNDSMTPLYEGGKGSRRYAITRFSVDCDD